VRDLPRWSRLSDAQAKACALRSVSGSVARLNPDTTYDLTCGPRKAQTRRTGHGGLVIGCSEADRSGHALLHTFARGFIGLHAYLRLHNTRHAADCLRGRSRVFGCRYPGAAERKPATPTTLVALVPPASAVAPVESREELAGPVRAGTRWVEAPELVV
jgi:hypothetical protein